MHTQVSHPRTHATQIHDAWPHFSTSASQKSSLAPGVSSKSAYAPYRSSESIYHTTKYSHTAPPPPVYTQAHTHLFLVDLQQVRHRHTTFTVCKLVRNAPRFEYSLGQPKLLRRALEHLCLVRLLRDEAVNTHLRRLPDAMAARRRLHIVLWVPVAVEYDHLHAHATASLPGNRRPSARTVSAAVKLMPTPPAFVVSKRQKTSLSGCTRATVTASAKHTHKVLPR